MNGGPFFVDPTALLLMRGSGVPDQDRRQWPDDNAVASFRSLILRSLIPDLGHGNKTISGCDHRCSGRDGHARCSMEDHSGNVRR